MELIAMKLNGIQISKVKLFTTYQEFRLVLVKLMGIKHMGVIVVVLSLFLVNLE
jgi:hypothetical protein